MLVIVRGLTIVLSRIQSLLSPVLQTAMLKRCGMRSDQPQVRSADEWFAAVGSVNEGDGLVNLGHFLKPAHS
jgi:hypothetical protein